MRRSATGHGARETGRPMRAIPIPAEPARRLRRAEAQSRMTASAHHSERTLTLTIRANPRSIWMRLRRNLRFGDLDLCDCQIDKPTMPSGKFVPADVCEAKRRRRRVWKRVALGTPDKSMSVVAAQGEVDGRRSVDSGHITILFIGFYGFKE